jgi:hypothetical protein
MKDRSPQISAMDLGKITLELISSFGLIFCQSAEDRVCYASWLKKRLFGTYERRRYRSWQQ